MTDAPSPGPDGSMRLLLQVVFVVDCSGSMAGERIASLNWAARTALPALREQAADHPEVDLRVRVLRFGTGASWTTPEPVPIDRFSWTNLVAGGESDMGAALSTLAAAFGAAAPDRALPPVVVLLSDGLPTDEVEPALASLLATELGGRAIRIPIAIGQDADGETLQAFGSDPALRPLRADDAEALAGRIRWVAGAPVAAAATGTPPAAGPEPEADGGLVW